jgi:hypothetical protein
MSRAQKEEIFQQRRGRKIILTTLLCLLSSPLPSNAHLEVIELRTSNDIQKIAQCATQLIGPTQFDAIARLWVTQEYGNKARYYPISITKSGSGYKLDFIVRLSESSVSTEMIVTPCGQIINKKSTTKKSK